MNAAEIASLLTAGMAAPTGPEDIASYTGQVVTWDELSGANTVLVNGVILSNLRVIQGGIGLAYQPGDVIEVRRKMTQYYIGGKVGAPGAGAAAQIAAGQVSTSEGTTSTSYTDLATAGPAATVYVGSSRRALVMFGAAITAASGPLAAFIGGQMSFQVSGASSIAAGGGSKFVNVQEYASNGVSFVLTAFRVYLVTAADGLNTGQNTFTAKYLSNNSGVSAAFSARNLTVIPF